MSFFNQISANTSLVTDTKGKVTCDARTKKLVTSWIKNEQWQFDDFATFIELIGIQTPVRISKNGNSFKCSSADGKEVTISFYRSDGPEFCSGIYIKSEKDTKCYVINSNVSKGNTIPRVTLAESTVQRDGKKLTSCYSPYVSIRELEIGNYSLTIRIDEPLREGAETLTLRNSENIEKYLLTLDSSLILNNVFDTVMGYLKLTDTQISKTEYINFCFSKNIGKKKNILSKISLYYGSLREYAELCNGETIHVFKNGNWRYNSHTGIKIVCSQNSQDYYSLSIKGSESTIIETDVTEVLKHAKELASCKKDFIESYQVKSYD